MKKLFLTAAGFVLSAFCLQIKGQGIIISPGASLVINGSGNIVINNGSLLNDGTFIAGTGTVSVTGSSNQTFSGSSTLGFYNLRLNKSAGDLSLARSLVIGNSLELNLGVLDLNGFNIDLGSTGNVLGENASAYIKSSSTGYLIRSVNLNAPTAVNPGNIGIELTSGANLGATIIRRGHQQQINSSGYSINRSFEIVPSNNSNLNATVKFFYLDNELAGINESELKQWVTYNNGATWSLLGADVQDGVANFVTKAGINSFGRMTLASSVSNPLPVQLLTFTAQLSGTNNLLQWSTTQQINSDRFELERSLNGSSFIKITSIAAAGNSSITNNYSYSDPFEFGAPVYYRLKMIDKNGKFNYSQIVMVQRGNIKNEMITVFPNPAKGSVNVRILSNVSGKTDLNIMNVNGVSVIRNTYTIQKGLNDISCNVGYLPQGIYFIRIPGIDKIIQFIKD